jgi:Leucine-rich repeat (LRR) protein
MTKAHVKPNAEPAPKPPAKRPKFHYPTLPDDLLINIFQFAIYSLRDWAWVQIINSQFRTCARKPRALSFMRVLVQDARQLNHFGPSLNGVSTLMFRSSQGLVLLPPMPALKTLHVIGAMDYHMPTISNLTSLCSLFLPRASLSNQSLHDLSLLSNLTSLSLQACRLLVDLAPLSSLTKLTFLGLDMCSNVFDLTPLSRLTSLTRLSLIRCTSIASLEPLSTLSNLRKLNLYHCEQLSDVHLSALSGLLALRLLVLGACVQIGDLGLRALSNLQLVELQLTGTQVTTAGLQAIQIKNLRRLDVNDTKVGEDVFAWPAVANLQILTLPFPATDTNLEAMSHMVELKGLRLTFPVTDTSLMHVSHLLGLKVLHIYNGEHITDQGFGSLAQLRNLTRLHLRGLKVTDVSSLSSFVNLQQLRIESDSITCESMRALRSLTNLTSLYLSECCNVADQGLENLSSLIKMRTLGLRKLRMTDKGLVALSPIVCLEDLDLSLCEQITGAGFRFLDHLSLDSIVLDGCREFTDAGVHALAANHSLMRSLVRLDLSNCDQITDHGWQELPHLKTLRFLHVAGCTNITDQAFVAWQHFALHLLDLSGCYGITDQSLRIMCLPAINELKLADCDQITDAGISVLSTWSTLKKLDVSFCDRLTNVGLQAISHIKDVAHVGCFGVSVHEILTEHIIDPNPHVVPTNEHAVDLLVQALLDFVPRDRRCIHIDTSYPNYLKLSGCRTLASVFVPVLPSDIEWALVASRIPAHKRWFFFLSPRKDIRVHARSQENRYVKKRRH